MTWLRNRDFVGRVSRDESCPGHLSRDPENRGQKRDAARGSRDKPNQTSKGAWFLTILYIYIYISSKLGLHMAMGS